MNVFELVGTLSIKGLDKAESDVKSAATKSEKSFDGMERSGKKAASGIGSAMGKIGKAVTTGVGVAVTAGAAFVGGLMSLASSAQESVEDMGKLSAAFDTAGWSASDAKSTFSDFVGILGETDQAVEASNHLAKLCNNQEELADWTDIAAGVYATFGDSLPLEGLTEAANETAKCGKVTGPFADALNWTSINAEALNSILGEGTEASNAFADAVNNGMSQEDAFNAALATCNDESERAAMVTEIMAGMYTEAGVAYQETNRALIDSRKAQADFTNAMGEAGKAVMPLQASILGLGAELVNSLVPDLATAGDGLAAMFEGKADGAAQFADGVSGILNGLVTKATEIIPSMIAAGMGILQGLLTGILNALPSLVTGIVGMLPQLVTTFMEMVTLLVQQLSVMIPMVLPQVVEAIASMGIAFVEALPQLIEGLITLVMALVDMLPTFVPTLLQAAITLFMALVQALPQIANQLATAIPTVIQTVVNLLPTFIPMIVNAAITMFMALVQSLDQIIPPLVGAIPVVIGAVVEVLPTLIPMLLAAAVQLFMALVQAVPLVLDALLGAVGELLGKLPGAIAGFAGDIKQGALDMMDGALKGVSEGVEGIIRWWTDNFKLPEIKFPEFKLPHFSIGGSWNPVDWFAGNWPTVNVEWYAKAMNDGMILNKPTIFGYGGGSLLGAGEAGSETIVGTGSLMSMIREAAGDNGGIEQRLDAVIELLARLVAVTPRKMSAEIDGREILRFLKQNGVVFV